MTFDVAIVGAGVIGSSVAREISRYRLNTVVLERGADVASGSSRANSGIVHAGYDAKPGTLKAKYNVEGNKYFDRLAEELDFPFSRCGSLVACFEESDIVKLEALLEQGVKNGVEQLEIIGRDRLLEMEPNIGDGVCAALYVPTGGIVCPYEMTIALAENAASNGVQFRLECNVEKVVRENGVFNLTTSTGEITAKILINAAGLYSDEINNMLSEEKIEIIPRRGEYCLLDKTEGNLVSRTIFQLPSKMGKGILVSPTVDGNILVGPTSEDISDKEDLSTTRKGLAEVLKKGAPDVKILRVSKVITSFTGLRPRCTRDEFIIGPSPDVPSLINLCGIESPGLSSAPAIARDVAKMVEEMTHPQPNENFNPVRKAVPRFRHMNNEQRKKLIAEDPDYSQVICRCETVTKGEILAALRSPLKIRSMDAVKRRTRTGMGRCQGGFCSMRLPEIIAQELGIPVTEVTKYGGETNLLLHKNKTYL